MAALAPIAVVAGSGIDLRPLLDRVNSEIPFSEIDGLPDAGAPGHAGRFVEGYCGRNLVLLQLGRLHVYEGYPMDRVVRL